MSIGVDGDIDLDLDGQGDSDLDWQGDSDGQGDNDSDDVTSLVLKAFMMEKKSLLHRGHSIHNAHCVQNFRFPGQHINQNND